MANRNLTATAILLDTPPRPETGNGAVILGLGNTQVRFGWEDGMLTAVDAAPRVLAEEEVIPLAVTCYKCAYESETGQRVCWSVPC